MDIFEFAIKMEKDGEQFYRELAVLTKNTGLQNILTMLADEEVKHAQAIRAIQTAEHQTQPADVLNHAKNIFLRMKEFGEPFETDIKEAELYKQAMEIEDKSVNFYLDRADQVKLPRQKQLFLKLAEEEKKHYRLMENLAEFVTRPKQWLENAEFFRPDQY